MWDYLIIGGGIVGLTIAQKLRDNNKSCSTLVLEKESYSGLHGSGRNSGVLHSEIYYKEGTLKAEMCAKGMRMMKDYCQKNNLPLNEIGKLIVPTRDEDDKNIELLYNRSIANGVIAKVIGNAELVKLDSGVRSSSGRALLLPETSVVDPMLIMLSLITMLHRKSVIIHNDEEVVLADPINNTVPSNRTKYSYKTLINAFGQYADRIAHLFEVGKKYTLIPFKGSYYKLDPRSTVKPTHLIYPVLDLKLPFLGIHSITTIDGSIYFGPTAIPVLGRENYIGLEGINYQDVKTLSRAIIEKYATDKEFRSHSHKELSLLWHRNFHLAVRRIMPGIKSGDLKKSSKVGIRLQPHNKNLKRLEMDFLIEKKENTLHVLNAISPAFT